MYPTSNRLMLTLADRIAGEMQQNQQRERVPASEILPLVLERRPVPQPAPLQIGLRAGPQSVERRPGRQREVGQNQGDNRAAGASGARSDPARLRRPPGKQPGTVRAHRAEACRGAGPRCGVTAALSRALTRAAGHCTPVAYLHCVLARMDKG